MLEYRKLGFIILLLLSFSIEGKAQENYLAGAGSSLELDNNLIGVNGRFFYGISEAFCFGPEISFFPYQDTDNGLEASIIDLNVNAHYIFEATHKLGIYPLSGINYTIEKERRIENNSESETENEFGLNYGFGLHYIIKNTFVFAEFKGVIGQLSGEFVTVGILFNFPKKHKKELHKDSKTL